VVFVFIHNVEVGMESVSFVHVIIRIAYEQWHNAA